MKEDLLWQPPPPQVAPGEISRVFWMPSIVDIMSQEQGEKSGWALVCS